MKDNRSWSLDIRVVGIKGSLWGKIQIVDANSNTFVHVTVGLHPDVRLDLASDENNYVGQSKKKSCHH